MIACNCIVQAGQVSADTEAVLRSRLSAFTEKSFGKSAEISWLAIPEKSGFTASKPSTSAIVSVRSDKPLTRAAREPLLKDLCAIWTEELNCSIDEIVVVISDPLPA